MPWIIPSDTVKGGNVAVAPVERSDSTFAPLIVGAAYTSITFTTRYLPVFDVFCTMDAAGSLQLFERFQSAGAGSIWRPIGLPFLIAAFAPPIVNGFTLVGLRVSGIQARWVLTNVDAIPATITELIIHNRSI